MPEYHIKFRWPQSPTPPCPVDVNEIVVVAATEAEAQKIALDTCKAKDWAIPEINKVSTLTAATAPK